MDINLEKLREKLENLTQEDYDKHYSIDNKPNGWLNIEEYLPQILAIDLMIGGTEYKVRYDDGTEGITIVSDHNTWYYYAKEVGITHWMNEK